MDIEVALASDPGCVREQNEDRIFYYRPEDAATLERHGILAVVADGMGGHLAGEVASQMAIDIVRRVYYENHRETDPMARLQKALLAANRDIHRAASQDRARQGMGTTCTALALRGRSAYCAHVGDSRLYLLRGEEAYLLTEDHSWVMDMVRAGVIGAEEARRHPDRNVLLRALGLRPKVEVSTWEQPLPVQEGDAFVLCSDGLHDLVMDKEIADAVGGASARDACDSLVAMAMERGGYDNISVGILKLGRPAENPGETVSPSATPVA